MEESRIEFGISFSDSMLNYQLSQKLELLGYGKFNHLSITSNKLYRPTHVFPYLIC